MKKLRGSAELYAAMLLALVVLGALSWMAVQWQRSSVSAQKRIEAMGTVSQATMAMLNCMDNYLVGLDPNTPTYIDLTVNSSISNATYCYSTLPTSTYSAYVVIPMVCSGAPIFYVITGKFVPQYLTTTIQGNVTVYIFKPNNLQPALPCPNPTFNGFAELHVVYPNGAEKIAFCYVGQVSYINTTTNQPETVWAVRSCTGA
ncbi:hypothetical protein IPA_06660 [Ignicoccus pacificus DSM 13166]|uniref:Uncharacterized protein n=1 Tax=Ignicoccus pacificus DSM 13166 TaxID=940294 RepID=A0A977PLR1_9CREN|nr:hypothetical protein IPA_06660 [Ignicoccus pacificus DSM 13166]